jgi:hypothetical protein
MTLQNDVAPRKPAGRLMGSCRRHRGVEGAAVVVNYASSKDGAEKGCDNSRRELGRRYGLHPAMAETQSQVAPPSAAVTQSHTEPPSCDVGQVKQVPASGMPEHAALGTIVP